MTPILADISSTILPSAPYILAAYAPLWVALLVYVLMVFPGTTKATAQLTLLEEPVADPQPKARAAKDDSRFATCAASAPRGRLPRCDWSLPCSRISPP